MKKLIVLALSTIMTLSLAACDNSNPKQSSPIETKSSQNVGQNIQISNPFIDCESLEAAANLAGFEILVPELIDNYGERRIRTIEDNMIEVIYSSGEKEIRIRKANGTEDVSGDFKEYAENNTADIEQLKITLRGTDGKVNVATWTDNNYTFALSISDGMASDDVISLVETVQ